MKGAWRLACVAGVDINVHWSFSFIILWMIWHGTFGNRELESVLFLSISVLLLFGCVVMHELGHALTAVRLNVVVKSIIILPIGGLAQIQFLPEKPFYDLLITVAGPLVNLALTLGAAFALVAVGRGDLLARFFSSPERLIAALLQSPFEHNLLTGMILFLLLANGVLFLFNLIPALPMDGGRMLRAALAIFLPYPRAAQITKAVGQAIAIIMLFAGYQLRSIGLLIIASFVLVTTWSMSSAAIRPRPSSSRADE